MWMSSHAARSDVVLAPAGIWVGAGLVTLALQTGLWPGGVVGLALLVVAAFVVMLGWPLWLARQRDDTVVGQAVATADLSGGLVAALPLLAGGVAIAWLQGVSWPSVLAGLGTRVGTSEPVTVALVLAITFATAVGAWLVLTLVARRAAMAWTGPAMPANGVARSYGLAMTGIATVLWLLLAVGTRTTAWRALLTGAGLAVTVLLVDGMLTSAEIDRTAVIAPAIVALVLWVFSGGLLFGGNLLANLASGMVGATVALCIGLLVEQDRPWAAAPLPIVLAAWLDVSAIPVLG